MKLVLICYNVTLNQPVEDVVKSAGVTSYTLWERVIGAGAASGPHLNTPIWPGYNSVMAVVADEAHASALLRGVRALRERFRSEGIKAFILPVEEVT